MMNSEGWMIRSLLICLLMFQLPCLRAADSNDADQLYFRNGDVLSGVLKRIDPEGGIQWSRPDAGEPMAFSVNGVERIDFTPRPVLPGAAEPNCRITLVNNDVLEGVFAGCDGETVRVETGFSGALALSRTLVRRIEFLQRDPDAIYDGPSSLDGWTQGRSQFSGFSSTQKWAYRNGAFYVNQSASIARDFKLPDKVRIDMDLRWQNSLNLAVALYTDTLLPVSLLEKEKEPPFGGFYSLQLRSYVYLMAITQKDPIRVLEPVMLQELLMTNRAHFSIFVNKQKKSIAISVNGNLGREWIDTNGFVGTGTGLRLVHQDEGGVKLSNLRIAPWNGVLAVKQDAPVSASQDVVTLRDGQTLIGRVRSVSQERLEQEVIGAVLNQTLSRVREVKFAGTEGPAPTPRRGDVRVLFGQSARLTFHLTQWSDEAVTGTNLILGQVRLNPATCGSVQFKPKP